MIKKVNRIREKHPLTWRLRKDEKPIFLKEYKNKIGYVGIKKALNMSSEDIIEIIINSGLKGRGGAGFPTGIKWNLMKKNINTGNRYLICNADEMEPGTYKDRLLLEKLPHLLIEGMIIAAYAINANFGYIFLRCEYIEAEKNIKRAIFESNEIGLLGNNILNSGFNFQIFIHTGAGRYICGEETALINSLEGRRANPRFKPPFPAEFGLWGKPTCINNVETLCNIPAIIENGVKWYKSLALKASEDHGTKLMGFSGMVNNPGLWELPFGITAREILEDYAYGMKSGLSLKAWLPGGASSGFLTKDHIDLPMDFKNIHQAGSRIGTGLAIAVDSKKNIVSLVKNIEEFFSRESCGWCTPCREGLPWIVDILHALENGNGYPEDINVLEDLCHFLGPGKTFCAHAPGAILPLKSAIKYFRSEFELGINKRNFIKYKNILQK